jgi:ABC-type lipoprotein export system ATPase subunit
VSSDEIWARPSEVPEHKDVGPPRGRPVLSARGVTRVFRRGSEEVRALKAVDLELIRGELVALVGRSGSGKTTLLNVLCGWEPADEGSVSFAGTNSSVSELGWRNIALIPQSPGLLDDLSAVENVGLPHRLAGTLGPATRTGVEQMLESLGLDGLADRLPMEMSLGEQQRTSVARALVANPDVLLADEPTAHQDELSMQRVLHAIRGLVDSDHACLVASHSAEVLDCADRVVEMHDGLLTVRPPSA